MVAVVTVLFLDIGYSTGVGSGLRAESVGAAISRAVQELSAVLERHGGTVEKSAGDAVVAVFGVPVHHEDDALRAVRAAVEMREALARLNEELEREWDVRLELRTGIDTGELDTAAAAATRLERAAAAGEILVGPLTRRIVGHLVRLEAREPVEASAVLGLLQSVAAPAPRLDSGGAADAESSLRTLLREAAHTGVVPATRPVATVVPRKVIKASPRRPAPARRAAWGGALLTGARLVGALLAAAAAAKWLLGWFAVSVEPAEAASDIVECTVFAPPSAALGDSILVQAFVHLPEQADDARAIATELDTAARRRTFRSLESSVPFGGRLDFELRMPGLEVDEPVASLVWRLRTEAVQFGVRIPPDAEAGSTIGTLAVNLDSAPLGHIKFKLAIERHAAAQPSEPQGEQAGRYATAFISYASADRSEVLRRVQVLSIVGIKYFQDVLSLEPGDRWLKRIELGIDECDLFLLFWSNEAKGSSWVRKEVQYALARKAGNDLSPPEIRPVILEGPPIVQPWEELADLHFNDALLYFMRSD